MAMKKIHMFREGEYWSECTYVEYAMCETGRRELTGATITKDWAHVNCKNCLKHRWKIDVRGNKETGVMTVDIALDSRLPLAGRMK